MPQNITIVQVYAPTSNATDEKSEDFYNELEAVLTNIPKKDILIVQGDWNAKIGPDAYPDWSGTVGKFAWGETNERGLRLDTRVCPSAQSHNSKHAVSSQSIKKNNMARTKWAIGLQQSD